MVIKKKKHYYQLLPYSQGGRHSGKLCMFDLADFYALHDVTPKGFVSSLGSQPGIFCLLVEPLHHTATEAHERKLSVYKSGIVFKGHVTVEDDQILH